MSLREHYPTTDVSQSSAESTPTRSVVVPIYGEYPPLWMDLVERIVNAGWDEVILCVDDPDEETTRALGRFDDDARIVVSASDDRRGKGGALVDGFDVAAGDVLGFIDADGAVSVEELECVFGLVANGDADVAVGSRGYSGHRRSSQSLLRRAFAFGYGMLARRATGVPVYDFQCGVKAFSQEAWEAIGDDVEERGFAIDTELIARLHHSGFRIREVSIDWNDPGDSSVSIATDVPRMLASLRRIHRSVIRETDSSDSAGALRVAMVSDHPPVQGHLAEYGEALAQEMGGGNVDLTVLAQRSDYAPSVEHRGNYAVRRLWARDSLGGALSLLRELLAGDYDVVHFNIHMTYFGTKNHYRFFGLALPPLIGRLTDARVVATLHDLLEVVEDEVIEEEIGVVQSLGAVFATQVLLCCDATTVTSDVYLDILESRYKTTEVHHVPHGTFRPALAARQQFEPPLRVLLFGHLSPSKDVETVVEAMAHVHESIPEAECWIAGDSHPSFPGHRELLEKRFSKVPGVHFTGYVEEYELDQLFDGSTLLVMPYRTCTGVSGVFQLAKSYGLPVVAFDIEGIRTSTVETGGNAEFVDAGDPAALAERIVTLWHDRERLTELAARNAAASTEWTIADTADRLLDVFAHDDADERRTGSDALDLLADAPCPRPSCTGVLDRTTFKDTDSVVCRSCETPAVRIWGE